MSDDESPQSEAMFRRAMIGARLGQGVSQSELARRLTDLGVPFRQQMIQRVETGDRAIRLNEATAICSALGLSLEEVMSGQESAPALEDLDEILRAKIHEAATLVRAGNTVRDQGRELGRSLRTVQQQLSAGVRDVDDEIALKLGYLEALRSAVAGFYSSLYSESGHLLRTANSVKRELDGLDPEDA